MIRHSIKKIKPYGNDEEINAFIIDPPYEELNIIKGISDLGDLDLEIEWIKELINRNVPDYTQDGFIIYQPFLWGSRKSKIGEINDNKIIGAREFDTKEFLDLCYAWKQFLKANI
ncbi:hypothetical protein [Sporocytophaga myxococcoides]|uniref:hypothetical protein n=1 Tax=Sporocytophaga myxococcoides TaxID=153721 RepID=UPI0004107E0C|nr:hypothetical protein [Sporocytophaga myxococcoides]